jgi:hypothetical protein
MGSDITKRKINQRILGKIKNKIRGEKKRILGKM